MAKAHRILPHGLPTECAPGLWRVVGSLPFPLKRNMFIVRLPAGGLLLYSVVAMNDAGFAALEALGRPTVMVVPHPFHVMDAAFYKARYPDIRVVGLPEAGAQLGGVTIDATPEQALPPLGLGFHVAPGLKYPEVVLEVPLDGGEGGAEGGEGGRGLIFTDLVGQNEGKAHFMMRILGAPRGAGVARIVKFRQIADKTLVRSFLRERAETPRLRLVAGCHGGLVTEDCAGWLQRAADGI